jgi:hypothetical protein
LVSGTEMGSGCTLLELMGSTLLVNGSTLLVMSEADVVPISNPRLLVVTIAKVTATIMNVSATPVTIPMILEWAEVDAMPLSNLGSPVDTVAMVLVASAVTVEASSKADRKYFPAKGLLRRGFLGSSSAPFLSALLLNNWVPLPS